MVVWIWIWIWIREGWGDEGGAVKTYTLQHQAVETVLVVNPVANPVFALDTAVVRNVLVDMSIAHHPSGHTAGLNDWLCSRL